MDDRPAQKIELRPIGWVVEGRRQVRDDDWDSVQSVIELDRDLFSKDALASLDSFSHVQVIFYMHRVRREKIQTGARHPRNNPDWPLVGILAQRAKNRPNQIGSTICRLEKVSGMRITLNGLDAVVDSPVLDLKPHFQEYGPRGPLKQPVWVSELMRGYWAS